MSLCTTNTCGDSSIRLGPVEAGRGGAWGGHNYTCTVTVSNARGSTTSDTNVFAFSGDE